MPLRWAGPTTFLILAAAAIAQAPLSAPPAPPQNPTTPARSVLGKMLFWEEQLSSSGRVACGTCHLPESGGGDARRVRHPGLDGQFLTLDDTFGSPGVERRSPAGAYELDPWFGDGERVTRRAAPSVFLAAWFDELFWDGSVGDALLDPISGTVVIPAGAALEHQALHPFRDPVEMSRPQRPWSEIVGRLTVVAPMALASDLPPDMQAALVQHGSYPALFGAAFGDPAITPTRIAMAIASYLRSTVPDQTPWDAYAAGQASALTPAQQAGLQVFVNDAKCGDCHTPGLFTDREYRSVGLTATGDDPGRGAVTGLAADLGRFKVPSLRNAALKSTFMHNGRFTTMQQVVNFYRNGGGTAMPADPLLQPFSIDNAQTQQLLDFLQNALVDARLANRQYPFDRPTLLAERQPLGANLYGVPSAAGGFTPSLAAQVPLYAGNGEWSLGVSSAPPAAPGLVLLDLVPGQGLVLQGAVIEVGLQAWLGLPIALDGQGRTTLALPIPWLPELRGLTFYTQVLVAPSAGVLAATRGATLVLY